MFVGLRTYETILLYAEAVTEPKLYNSGIKRKRKHSKTLYLEALLRHTYSELEERKIVPLIFVTVLLTLDLLAIRFSADSSHLMECDPLSLDLPR